MFDFATSMTNNRIGKIWRVNLINLAVNVVFGVNLSVFEVKSGMDWVTFTRSDEKISTLLCNIGFVLYDAE